MFVNYTVQRCNILERIDLKFVFYVLIKDVCDVLFVLYTTFL